MDHRGIPCLLFLKMEAYIIDLRTSFSSIMTSLVAQAIKHLPIMRETRVRSLGREELLEKEMATHSSTSAFSSIITFTGFSCGSAGKESTCNAGDTGGVGLIPGLGRSTGGGHGNPLQ